jgi:enoyl-[acyl-carrier protein] reductase III
MDPTAPDINGSTLLHPLRPVTLYTPMPFAFVTGGSRGIGRAIVDRLARDGFDVAFNYRRDDAAASEAERSIRAHGRKALALKADLGDPAQVATMLDALTAAATDVRVFVANAAATAFRALLDTKPHHVEKTYAITIGAFLQIVQRLAPQMADGGRIVSLSGMDTHRYVAGHGILASAKAALEALTRYLAVELGPRGITVNAVNPGYVETDSVTMYLQDAQGRQDFLDEIAGSTPLRALGSPVEVASLVAWLCTREADWMQGQVLYLDGGIFLHAPGHSVRWWKKTGRMPS